MPVNDPNVPYGPSGQDDIDKEIDRLAWTIRLFESQDGLIRAAARALENYQEIQRLLAALGD